MVISSLQPEEYIKIMIDLDMLKESNINVRCGGDSDTNDTSILWEKVNYNMKRDADESIKQNWTSRNDPVSNNALTDIEEVTTEIFNT